MIDVPVESDGRRLRRERGRRAVMDALIDLVLESRVPPTALEVAERAGVSEASLFRYFATLDDLRRAAIDHYLERFGALIDVPDIGEGDLCDRIDRLVETRDAFYVATAPMARLVRRQLIDADEFAVTLDRFRSRLADQIDRHFAPELARLDPAQRVRRVAVVASVTSFESWDQLTALGDRGRREAFAEAVGALVGAPVGDGVAGR